MSTIVWLLLCWFAAIVVLCVLFRAMKRHERDMFGDPWDEVGW